MRQAATPAIGLTPDAGLMGFDLTHGLTSPLPGGAFVMRRRALWPTPAPWTICGWARPGATSIEQWDGFGHDADQAYEYSVAHMLGNGRISDWSVPVMVAFDNLGNHIAGGVPNAPAFATAGASGVGTFNVTWGYSSVGQGAPPADFQIFEGPDADNIDYGTAIGTVLCHGRLVYWFETGAYADGTMKAFAVRARSAAGVSELNETAVSRVVRARAAAPADANIELAKVRG